MSTPIPIRPAQPPTTSIDSDSAGICSELLASCRGYALIGSQEPDTATRLAETIARIADDGSHPLIPRDPFRQVIDATAPGNRSSDAPALRSVPTRPGANLDEWSREVARTPPRLVLALAGALDNGHVGRLHALRDCNAPVLVTMPMRSHAKALADFVETAKAAGFELPPESVGETIIVARTTEPCQACYGFWSQTRRRDLLEHFGPRIVSLVESKTTAIERSLIRTWRQSAACPACKGEDAPNLIYSRVAWTPPLLWILSREGPETLDRAIAEGKLGALPIASAALVKVALGEAPPDILTRPVIAGEIDIAQLDHETLALIRDTS